jgi:single-strand DNA-binding protein
MAADNHTTIIGSLIEDPELRFTQNGIAVTNLRVAVTQRIQQDGEWRDGDTSFLKVNVWRGQAEHLADSLSMGIGSWSPGGSASAAGRPQRERSARSPRSRPTRSAPPSRGATAKVERAQDRGDGERTQGRGRQAERGGDFKDAPQTPLPPSGWLKNGCAVLPAPDREWLNSASVCQIQSLGLELVAIRQLPASAHEVPAEPEHQPPAP